MDAINPVNPCAYNMYPFNRVAAPVGTDLIRVNGMDSAKAYPTQPNSRYALFDENDDVMYIKQTDASNFPTIKRYRFVEENEKPTITVDPEKFVTIEEFNKFKEELLNGKHFVQSEPAKSK